jgi:chaperonin GroES
MKVRPLYDRILIRRVEAEERTQGGIIIPDSAKEKPLVAHVEAVGQGRLADGGEVRPLTVQVGNRVLISKYAGTEVKLEGSDYLIIREDDVLGIVEE